MSGDNQWSEILQEALTAGLKERPDAPILGTRFRQLVEVAAASHNQTFPPPDEPGLKFADLLERYPNIVLTRRRGGQDMLIAPANKPELLLHAREWPAPSIRQDIFNAFTRISVEERPWYDRERDAVVWLKKDAVPDSTVPVSIPSVTLEAAVEVRKAFVATVDPSQSKELEAALTSSQPLALFTNVIRSRGLQRLWHVFRSERLAESISAWAKAAGIPFREEWFGGALPQFVPSEGRPRYHIGGESGWRTALMTLAERLDESDLARISVPLDIVLRALGRRR